TGTIYATLEGLDTFLGRDVLGHEIGRLLDSRLCASAATHDPEYAGLNDTGFRYGDPRNRFIGLDVATPKAAVSLVEDKATVFESIIPGQLLTYTRKPRPVPLAKFRLLLARLE